MNNDERMRQFRHQVQGLTDGEREKRAREFEHKLPGVAVGTSLVYRVAQQVAIGAGVWIVARQTNRESFKYVGQTGYTAKDITCKPKTADRNNAFPPAGDRAGETAGLVTSPRLCPTSFTRDRLQTALEEWQKFERILDNDHYGYSVHLGDKHHGCLKREGKFIHGDLDLFDVINPQMVRDEKIFDEKIEGHTNKFTVLGRHIGDQINELLPAPMVLHGGQAQYGAFLDEGLFVFAPHGQRQPFELMSRIQARLWYKTRWPGRVPAGAGKDWLLQEM